MARKKDDVEQPLDVKKVDAVGEFAAQVAKEQAGALDNQLVKDASITGNEDESDEDTAPENIQVTIVKEPVKSVRSAEVVAPKVKKVRIHLTEDIDSYVGDTHYVGRKDRDMDVPTDVAAIFVNGKKAYRI